MIDYLALTSGALLVSVWIVYPALMALLARFRRATRPLGKVDLPSATVVIATREAAEVMRARVENCLDTDYPADLLTIVVAWDAGRAPDTDEWGVRDPRVSLVAGDFPGGKAGALNAGVRAATGEVLVFADAHQRFRRDTLPHLVEALVTDRVEAVSGQLELPGRQASLVSAYWSLERKLRRNEATVHSGVGVTGAIWAMRRELWQPLPAGVLLDDVYTPMSMVLRGGRVGYTSEALAFETRVTTPGREFARKVRTLTGVIQLCVWLPAVLSPLKNPIWGQFVFHKLLRLLTPYCVAALVLWAGWQLVMRLPGFTIALLLTFTIGGVWLLRTRRERGRRFRTLIAEGVLLQAAVLLAGINGLRGRWQVWDA